MNFISLGRNQTENLSTFDIAYNNCLNLGYSNSIWLTQ